jgi:ribonuclease HI
MQYRKGELAVKNVGQNYLEESLKFYYGRKETNTKEKIHLYTNVLISDQENIDGVNAKVIQNLSEPFDIEEIRIYSDGASYNNGFKDPSKPQYGSYGTVILQGNNILSKQSCADVNWTNNIGEISGVIAGLVYVINETSALNRPVFIISDSQYVIRGCTEWMHGWKKKNWKNNTGQEIANIELWKILDNLMKVATNSRGIDLGFRWVRGHTLLEDQDSMLNEECDRLASQAISKKFGVRI